MESVYSEALGGEPADVPRVIYASEESGGHAPELNADERRLRTRGVG